MVYPYLGKFGSWGTIGSTVVFLGKHYSPWTMYSFVSFPSILNLVSAKLVNCSFRDPVLEDLYLELSLPLFRPRKEVNMIYFVKCDKCTPKRTNNRSSLTWESIMMKFYAEQVIAVRTPMFPYPCNADGKDASAGISCNVSQQHFIHLWNFKINICIRKPAQQSNKITVI